jgi:hypothetical protein
MNTRYIHVAMLIACTLCLVLGAIVAAEDSPYWGQLQWVGLTLFDALLGALIWHSARTLATEGRY